jgi:hypothetical protein
VSNIVVGRHMDRLKPALSRNWTELGERIDPIIALRLRSYPVVAIEEISDDPLFGKALALVFEPKLRPLPARPRLFERFLEAKTQDQMLTFAKQTGALGLCIHGLPTQHAWLRSSGERGRHRVATGNPDFCSTWNRREPEGREVVAESLAAWQAWAESARALCGVAARLHSRRPPNSHDEDLLRNPGPPFRLVFESEPQLELIKNSGDAWQVVGTWVNVWLTLSRVELQAGLFRDGLKLELAGKAPLLGYLATSLATAVTRMPGLGFCSGCGAPFFPKRRQTGRASYCEACGVQAAWRDAKRRARGHSSKAQKEA